jgi:hypothetical protein
MIDVIKRLVLLVNISPCLNAMQRANVTVRTINGEILVHFNIQVTYDEALSLNELLPFSLDNTWIIFNNV